MATHVWPDWKRWRERDRRLAVALNNVAGDPSVMRFYRGVSRLGDGMLWYALMAALPVVGGDTGWECAKQMGLTGLLSLVIYIVLKRGVCRPRPYLSCEEIHLCGRVLDQFSFPSGHTLHAVSFSIVMAAYYPRMALALAPFTLMVALSRVILGLHYPSDVLAGAGLGVLIGGLSVWLF